MNTSKSPYACSNKSIALLTAELSKKLGVALKPTHQNELYRR